MRLRPEFLAIPSEHRPQGALHQSAPPDPSRRKALKVLSAIAIGGCIVFLGSGLLPASRSGLTGQTQSKAYASAASTVSARGNQAKYLRVKVRYFQMSSTLPGISEEYFVLPDPANYGDLLHTVTAAHPVLATMLPSMLILVDGVVAKGEMQMRDGDEADFIPVMSGG